MRLAVADEDQRVDRRGGEGAAAAPAAQGEKGMPRPRVDQRLLGFGRADEADGKGQDRRRARARRRASQFQQTEQRGRRVADRDHGAGEALAPQLDGGGGARRA